MTARISQRAGVPRRAFLIALVAAFFIPTTSHAITAQDTCGPAGADKGSAVDLASIPARTCYGDTGTAPNPTGYFAPTPPDWYKFTLLTPTAFGLRFHYGTSDQISGASRVFLIGPKGDIPATSVAGEWHLRIGAGEYFLKIGGTVGFPDYAFTYDLVQHTDCNVAGDAGDSRGTATQVFLPTSCAGRVWGSADHSGSYKDPEDWYQLSLNQGDTFIAYLYAYGDVTDGCSAQEGGTTCTSNTIGLGGPTYELRDSRGALIEGTVVQQTNLNAINYAVTRTDTYFLRVSATTDELYSLTMSNTGVPALPIGNDSCASPDASNTPGNAAQLFPAPFSPQTCYGFLTPGTDATDWYKFDSDGTSASPQSLTFQMDSDQGATYDLIDPQNIVVVSGSAGLGFATYTQQSLTKPGTWKLKLYLTEFQSQASKYEFTLDVGTANLNLNNLPSIPPSLPPIGVDSDTCPYQNTTDAGNDRGHGGQISPANPYCVGAINKQPGDTADWYVFNANKDDKFSFMVSGEGLFYPNVEIRRPNGSLYPHSIGANFIPDYTFESVLDASGQWAIKVSPESEGAAGNYLMMFYWHADLTSGLGSIPPSIPGVPTIPSIGLNVLTDDCFGTGDAGDRWYWARSISPQTSCAGTMATTNPKDVQDWYSFTGRAGQNVIIGVMGDGNLDADFQLYTPKIQRVISFPSRGPIPDYLRYEVTHTGTHYIRILRGNETAGRYGLFVDNVNEYTGVPFVPGTLPGIPSLTGDCGQPGDAPNNKPRTHLSKQPARDYSPNNTCVANMSTSDREDWYQFGASAGQHFTISLQSSHTLDADLYLVDPTGRVRGFSKNGGLYPEYFYNYVIPRTGAWRLKVHWRFGSGDYSLSSTLANY